MNEYHINYTDYMLDIETLGKSSRAAVVQIGVCGFNITTGEVGNPHTLWLEPHRDAEYDYDTIRWWMTQTDDARASVFGREPTNPAAGLTRLNDYLPNKSNSPGWTWRLWAMPPEFDITILKSLYGMCNRSWPWEYNATRDLRTLEFMVGAGKEDRHLAMVKHDAGADAQAQALTAIKYWWMSRKDP